MARTSPARPTRSVPSFAITPADRALVEQCVERYVALRSAQGITTKRGQRLDFAMDLIATHANGNPMDFGKLLAADDFNFLHDILGIAEHLDRHSGKLLHCFSPRCSAPTA